VNTTSTVLKVALRLSFILALAVLTACATSSGATKSKDPFPERAQARWDALLSGDIETAYSFLSPGYRSTMGVVDYGITVRTRKVKWISSEYIEHSCEESRCLVKFKIGFRVIQPVPGMDTWDSFNVRDETWVKTNGEWWYLPGE
jgi:hypothetical protein